jgi:hypothetical protein
MEGPIISSVKNPSEKKRHAYERDHYNRNGEANKAWRKAKPLKKSKARRAFRKNANDLTKILTAEDSAPATAVRKEGRIRQTVVADWGSVHLAEFVQSRLERRAASVGAKKKRRLARVSAKMTPRKQGSPRRDTYTL